MYYNTTRQKGENLQLSIAQAGAQDERVLGFFKKVKSASASFVWSREFKGEMVPITSVRRSINTLTKQGFLEKTPDKVQGIYGKPEYIWRLNKN